MHTPAEQVDPEHTEPLFAQFPVASHVCGC
jgi:hypothetical protein